MCRNFRLKKKFEAFSLLESVFAILIIGVLSAGVIKYWKFATHNSRQVITLNRANYIRKAMEGYVARYGFLPYASNKNGKSKNKCLIGNLPYKELGISKNYEVDGFGKKFVYIVNENLVLEKHKKDGRKILPIYFPNSLYPCFGSVAFCRLYDWRIRKKVWEGEKGVHEWKIPDYYDDDKNMNRGLNSLLYPKKVFAYDKIDASKNITIKQKKQFSNISYINNFLKRVKFKGKDKVLGLISYFDIKTKKTIPYSKKDKIVNEDIIAWTLISTKNGNNYQSLEIEIYLGDIVFWQSRKNLAAQLGYPSSTENLDVTEIYNFYITD